MTVTLSLKNFKPNVANTIYTKTCIENRNV